jgi:hypothetical protein
MGRNFLLGVSRGRDVRFGVGAGAREGTFVLGLGIGQGRGRSFWGWGRVRIPLGGEGKGGEDLLLGRGTDRGSSLGKGGIFVQEEATGGVFVWGEERRGLFCRDGGRFPELVQGSLCFCPGVLRLVRSGGGNAVGIIIDNILP